MRRNPLSTFGKLFAVILLLTFLSPMLQAHVQLLAPNGGEVLDVGSTYTIQWQVLIQHSTQNWDLSYSTTGPNGPWLPIADNLPTGDPTAGSIHTYDWTIPETISDQVRVRVIQDNGGLNYLDKSNNDLSISYLAMTATPNPVSAGQVLSFQTEGASLTGAIAALVIVDLNGSPAFTPIVYGNLGVLGSWPVSGTVPPVVSGVTITFRTYARQGNGPVRFSNDQVVVFQ